MFKTGDKAFFNGNKAKVVGLLPNGLVMITGAFFKAEVRADQLKVYCE